jgi:hypothetical protein
MSIANHDLSDQRRDDCSMSGREAIRFSGDQCRILGGLILLKINILETTGRWQRR